MTETFTCHPVLTTKTNYDNHGTKEFGLWDMSFVSWYAHTKASNEHFEFNLWASCVLYRIGFLIERTVDAKLEVGISAGLKADGVSCSVSAERAPGTNTNPGQLSATLAVGINPAFGRPDDMVDIDVTWATASSGGAIQVGVTPAGQGGAAVSLPNDDGSVNGYSGLFHWVPKKVVIKSGPPGGKTTPPPPPPVTPTGKSIDPWAAVGEVFDDLAPVPFTPDPGKQAKAPVKSFGVVLAATLALIGGNAATAGDTTKPVAAQSPSPSAPAATGPTGPTGGTGPSASPSGPRLTGGYGGTIGVKSDPHGHSPFIGKMPGMLDVRVVRDTMTGVITVTVGGAEPFVPVSASDTFDVASGHFTATGKGTVTDRDIPVTSAFDGTLANGELNGTFTYTGTPNGPITYSVDMAKTT